jgi:hypothetical protein
MLEICSGVPLLSVHLTTKPSPITWTEADMMRELFRDEIAGKVWSITADDGSVHFEVKLKGHRLQQFSLEIEAHKNFDRWAPEIEKEIELFDR